MEGRGHRVVEERIDSSTKQLDEESSIATDSTSSWPSTFETDMMDNEILETVDYVKSSPEIVTTTQTSSEEVIPEDYAKHVTVEQRELKLALQWTTSVESTTPGATSAGKEDDPANDSSTTFPTSIVDESTITTVEDLSSMDDATTESRILLSEASGNDTVPDGEKKIDVRKENISSSSSNAQTEENLEPVNSTVSEQINRRS